MMITASSWRLLCANECLEVIIRAHVPKGTAELETPGTGRFSRASAMSRSIPVCLPVMEELQRVRCAPI